MVKIKLANMDKNGRKLLGIKPKVTNSHNNKIELGAPSFRD